ncbi:MAG: FeoA family protein [Synergistaceae bacterium]|nr:FeoA family protein [Synergistaceae bacterium]
MPLTMLRAGEERRIVKINGDGKTRQFLENLGFVTGETVRVVSKMGDNLIVNVKESRVAVSCEAAMQITV